MVRVMGNMTRLGYGIFVTLVRYCQKCFVMPVKLLVLTFLFISVSTGTTMAQNNKQMLRIAIIKVDPSETRHPDSGLLLTIIFDCAVN